MNLFKLVGQLAIEGADEAKNEIRDVTDEAEGSSGKLGNALSKIGNVALGIGKAVAVGATASATAIIGVTKSAVDAYAQYQQLVGGVETLYKDSADKVLEYANKAYASAGMSANKYMETVTSFTASLLQGLNGDTAKTAEVADMAIRDMSDNANKMGTSMEMIQNAYQGFSKQNYMMLDNLKLGYGGTKGEMERLLADAEKLTGVKYDISNLADVYNAIHVIQQELGITGTTALEAGSTITGSMSAVKAQWDNIMVALANDNANLGEMIDVLIGNLETMLGNMLPTIQTVFSKIPSLLVSLAPLLGQMILNLAPSLLTSIYELIKQLGASIPTLLGNFRNLFTQIYAVIQENLPIFVDKAREMMAQFGAKIQENLPAIISKALDILTGLSQTLLTNAPSLIASGMDLLMNIAKGFVNAMPTLIQKVPQIITNIANTITRGMQTILMKGAEIVWELIKGIIGAIPTLIQEFPKVIEAIFAVWNAINWMNLGKNLVTGIKDGIKALGTSLKNTASNLFNSLKNNTQSIFTRIGEIIKSPILTAKTRVLAVIGEMQNGLLSVFKGIKTNATSIFNGIKTAITNPIQTAKNTISSIVNAIKSLFSGLKITFPKIALPHFSISPRGWKISDLLKGSIPSLGISWYAKAMDAGMILDKPTIFGYQNGNLLAGGEAGSETVVGTNSLMSMIQQSVMQSNARNEELMSNILSLLATYIPEMANTRLVLDTGVLVGEIAPKVDRELGMISRMKERGR